jgi:hypothetical protein
MKKWTHAWKRRVLLAQWEKMHRTVNQWGLKRRRDYCMEKWKRICWRV